MALRVGPKCQKCNVSNHRIAVIAFLCSVSSSTINTTLQQVILAATAKPNLPKADPAPQQRYNPSEYSNHPSNAAIPGRTGPHHSGNRDERVHQSHLRNDENYESRTGGYGDQRGAESGSSGRRKISPEEQAEKYFNDYQNLLIRCEAMVGEEEEILAAVERKNREIAKQKVRIL